MGVVPFLWLLSVLETSFVCIPFEEEGVVSLGVLVFSLCVLFFLVGSAAVVTLAGVGIAKFVVVVGTSSG